LSCHSLVGSFKIEFFFFWHLQKASGIDGNGIFVRVAGVVPILTIIDALVVVDFLHSFIDDCRLCFVLPTAYSKVPPAPSNGNGGSLAPNKITILRLLSLPVASTVVPKSLWDFYF
jgi:hypothetical protein